MKDRWQKITLGAAFTTVTGNTPSKSNPKFYGSFIPFVKPPELLDDTVELAEDGLSEYGAKVARVAPQNSILVSCIGNLGKIGLNTVPVAFNQQINAILLPAARVMPRFMFYQTLSCSFKSQLEELASGTTVKIVNKSKFNSIEVVLPPLAEQKRIVAKLDEAFVGLAKAKENAEKNLQNARELFESTLDDVFMRNSEDWAVKQLEDVCVIGDGNHSSNYPKKHELVAKGVPFIRATNLVGGEISNEDMRFLSPKKHSQLKKGHLKTGDILFTNRGEIGKMAIVDPSHDGSNLNSQVAWLRCNETLNNRFLFHFLNSGKIKAHLESAKNGAALQQFTIKQIKELKIPIPSRDQQKEIVLGLDGLSKKTQRLTRLYEQKLEALESLKKSLLHEAFSGNL